MWQAEIAGGTVTPRNESPSKGHRLREFELVSATGRTIHLSDFRGRANLVVIVDDGQSESAKLISDAATQYPKIKDECAEVLAIVRMPRDQAAQMMQRLKLSFPVLVDEDGGIHRELGAVNAEGHDSAAVYITDQFGEVFAVYRTREGQSLPNIADILNWLEFVNAQCPECEAPEWPI